MTINFVFVALSICHMTYKIPLNNYYTDVTKIINIKKIMTIIEIQLSRSSKVRLRKGWSDVVI